MARRVLAFFLGFLMGIVFIFGALALGIYVTATVVHPSDIYPDSSKFLGDLANMSLYEIYQSVAELYRDKVGVTDEDGRYFTFGQFCEHYNINPNELFGGKEVPQDVLDVPIFEFFAENGKDPAMQQIKVSALFAFVNMFAAGQDGNGFFTQNALEKLGAHNMSELSEEGKGFAYVFQEVMVVDMLPTTFPQEKEGNNSMMWALGQTSIGRLMGGLQGNILLQFKEEGAFAAMGSLYMTELLGEGSSIINATFGNSRFRDLIDDNGNVNFDGLMDDVYLGNLFDYHRGLYEGDTSALTLKYGDETRALLTVGEGEDEKFVLRFPAKTEGEYDYYEAQLTCVAEEHSHDEACGVADEDGHYSCGKSEHAHDETCYEFVWYKCNPTEDEAHEHAKGCLASGMMGKLSNTKVMELGGLNDTIMTFTLYDVMGDSVPKMLTSIKDTPISQLGTAIDSMYLGDFLQYQRVAVDITAVDCEDVTDGIVQFAEEAGEVAFAKRDRDGNWYNATFNCPKEDEHGQNDHDADCYEYVWYTTEAGEDGEQTLKVVDGVMGNLASILISELNGKRLTEVVDNTRLGDVIPGFGGNKMLAELADVKIGNLSNELNALYVGSAMGYFREEAAYEFDKNNPVFATSNVFEYASDDYFADYFKYDEKKGKYYDAVLNCADTAHDHDDKCFGYAWYKCAEGKGHDHDGDCLVKGLDGKMSNLSMLGLSSGELGDVLKSLTIGDLIDSGMITLENLNDSSYKFAIITCSKIDGDNCSLADYLVHSVSGVTPEQYWRQQHDCVDEMTPEDVAHRDAWKNLSLATFINNLLEAF